jgi:hypothetical protein
MTTGRDSNIAYVALDKPDEGHPPPELAARTVLCGAARCARANHRRGGGSSRHTTRAPQQAEPASQELHDSPVHAA